jgi:hypothetical protein
LIGYTWIMNQEYQCDRPALHIAEPVILNCPSGPFRSEFLMSKQTTLFRCDRCFCSDMEKENLAFRLIELLFRRLSGSISRKSATRNGWHHHHQPWCDAS